MAVQEKSGGRHNPGVSKRGWGGAKMTNKSNIKNVYSLVKTKLLTTYAYLHAKHKIKGLCP